MSQQNDFTVSFTASFCLGAPKRLHGFASGMSKFLDGRDWGKAGRAYRIRGGFYGSSAWQRQMMRVRTVPRFSMCLAMLLACEVAV